MPSIQETLYSALSADTALAAIVGDRIFPGQIPDDEAPAPWLYYSLPESVPVDDLDGEQLDAQAQVEFHALGETYAQAKSIIEAVFGVLNAYTGGQITLAIWRGTSEDTTEEGYHHVARFEVFGSAATVTTTPGANARITTGLNILTLTAGGHTLTLSAAGLLLDGSPLGGGGGGAVDSVNGQTGIVVLDAGDVGADPAGTAAAAVAPLATIATSVYVSAPANGTLVLSAKAAFAFALNQLRGLKTSAGTLMLSVQINGTNVTGLSGLSVTTSAQDATATAANVVAAGDRVTVVIAGASSPANLEFTLAATR